MTSTLTAAPAPTAIRPTVRPHRPLMVATAAMVGLSVVCLIGVLVDDRVLVGAPIWLKPLKFSISLAIYLPTIAWLTSLLDRWRRTAAVLGTLIAIGGCLEQVAIIGQVIRGRQSHFNVATSFDAALFSFMGATIAGVWLCTAVIGVLVLRQRIADRATGLAVRAGLLVGLAGMAVGFLMTMPTRAQVAAMHDAPPTVVGGHSVGVADGGPGLPVVGWSTVGGDLRIGHFVGLHALQALPLLALLLGYAGGRWSRFAYSGTRTRLVGVAAVGYAGLVGLLTWQALRGQSIVHPDAVTLATAGALLTTVVAGTGWAIRR